MKSKTKIFTCGMMALFLMIASIFFSSSNIDKKLVQTSGSLELSNNI